jgi:peptide/nickel transport system permease protein
MTAIETAPPVSHRRRGPRHAWYWVVLLLVIVATIVLHGDPAPPDNVLERFQGPSRNHWFGTDELGRDVFKSVVVGLSWSVEVSALGTALAALIGIVVGVVAGWYDRWWARLVLRLIDFQVSFPFVVLGVVLIGIVGRGTLQIALVLGVAIWPLVGRIVYAEVLQMRSKGYVVYSRLVSRNSFVVLTRHVIPAVWGRVMVICAFVLGDLVGAAAALSLLGIGPALGTPTWGNMLAVGQQYLGSAPWMVLAPSLALVLLVVFVNLFADMLAARADGRDRLRQSDG